MRVSIIKEKKIKKLSLPETVEGTFWIDDIDSNGITRNLISISSDNNHWKVNSNNEVYLIENEVSIPYAYLENYHFYKIHNEQEEENFILYCYPNETNYSYYDVTNAISSGITIGSDKKNTICYEVLGKETIKINIENNKIFMVTNGPTYVNDARIYNKKELKNGDILFTNGLKILIFIYVNAKGELAIYFGIDREALPNIGINLMPTTLSSPLLTEFVEPKEEMEYPLYDEQEYFHKMPRFISQIETLELKVDAPPSKSEDQNSSLLMTIGPMITMSMTSIVTSFSTISNVTSGKSNWQSALPSLIVSGAMFASVFVWPLFSKMIEAKSRHHNEKLRQKKYSAYIEAKRKSIVDAKKEQTAILKNNYPDLKTCEETILKKYTTLWQRKLTDQDYLKVNLGNGTCPMDINIHYPEDHFSMVEDNLKEMVNKLGSEPKLLTDVPIEYSLIENFISGLIGEEEITGEYMKRLLLQIIAFHSYDNLKIIILTDNNKYYQWKMFKDLPHVFTDDKLLRFFATNNDEYKEVCYYLDRIFNARKDLVKDNITKVTYDKTYLIITDSFKKVRDFEVIDSILENKNYYGFNLLIIDNKLTNLPDQCQSFIKITKESGELNNNQNYKDPIKFTPDLETNIDLEACIKRLANIPIEIDSNEEGQLPNKLGFLEMFDVGKIEQLNALNRWQISNPMLNLSSPVGVGKNGEKIAIDLHEKYHGPHGLVAGMTGSGKSEFIITYILSMAINYHPYEVQFILIDYKGGGLAGAFENHNIGLKLPHLVGTITNLDANEIKRSLASIESELKRRQALFNKARESSKESTIDIYKYQKMYRDGLVEEPVSHLFIISDEFAELKTQQPEFMEQLISTARIGRSLGVHLILATQKPSGVVDPQIWSNTRFRVCMRVQEKSDSNEVIKCPDAAYLKQTGRFYFQVGYNEVFTLGQAAWAGGKYYPQEKVKKNIDTSLEVINNIGYVIKNVETKEKETNLKEEGEELINLVKYLSDIAKEQNIKCKPLWLEKIPEDIRVEDLKVKYNYQKENYVINPIIGEYDVPASQEQRLLTLPLSKEGNAIVYGSTGSGKENFITTLIYSCMQNYFPKELNIYLIDFGSGALKMFNNCHLVGDILTSDSEEKIKNLYKMLSKTIEERKELFTDYNGEYLNYCKNNPNPVPNILVIINNYESYQETYSEFDEELVILSRECNKYGIYFLLTCNTPNAMRFKLKQNFTLIYALNQNSTDDYITILGNVHGIYPSKIFGRGIIKLDDIYEFQTALACEKDNIPNFIKEKCNLYNNNVKTNAQKVPVLPKIVSYQDISSALKPKTDELILGISKNSLDIITYNFHEQFASLITALDIDALSHFLNPLINEFLLNQNYRLIVFNPTDFEIDSKYTKFYEYKANDLENEFLNIYDYIDKLYTQFKENNYDKNLVSNIKKIMLILLEPSVFLNKLSMENKDKFKTFLSMAKELEILDLIMVDSIDKIKKLEMESWFKDYINTNYGIYLGNGLNEQFTLKTRERCEESKKDIPDNFAFVIKKGKPELIKILEELDLKIKD